MLDGINGLQAEKGDVEGFTRHAPSAGGQGDDPETRRTGPDRALLPERGIPSMTGLKNCWPPWRGGEWNRLRPPPAGAAVRETPHGLFCQTSIWARRIVRADECRRFLKYVRAEK